MFSTWLSQGQQPPPQADTSVEVSELDEAMKEIQASIDEFTEQPTAEGSDDESDSEDEEEGGRSLCCDISCVDSTLFLTRCAKD